MLNLILNLEEKKILKKFIADLMKYSSKTPMLKSRKQQDEKVIKSYLDKNKKIGNYYQTFIRLNNVDLVRFIKKCISGDTNTSFIIDFDYKSKVKDFFPFVVYLTAKQKRFYYSWLGTKRFELEMSKTQFHKTCFASIVINRDIYYYKNYRDFPPPIKFNIKFIAPLAIEMKNLIDFDEDSIPTTTTTKSIPKSDLIPTTTTTKSDLIPKRKQKKIDEIMTKNLTDFTKDPYKSFTKNQSLKKIKTEVLNALVNKINYPLTKDVLGIKLTKDLKEKISKLTSEAAIALTWIIRALVLSNTKKLPVYYEKNNYIQLSKKEIKEIIEYYFTTLAILLNPAQKY